MSKLSTIVRMSMQISQLRHFITSPELYPIVKNTVFELAGSKAVVELDTDIISGKEAEEVFQSAGRAGDILLIKAQNVLPKNILVMVSSYQSTSSDGLTVGYIPRADGSSSSSDVAKPGFKLILWTTPEVFDPIHAFFKKKVFRPMQTFCFPTKDPDKQDWSIFDNYARNV